MIKSIEFKLLSLLLLMFLGYGSARATHIMGTDLTYLCKNDTFVFTLKVYRDCGGINLGATQTLTLYGKNSSRDTTINLTMSRISVKDITPTCSTKVSLCVGGSGALSFGYQEHVYRVSLYMATTRLQPLCQWKASWTQSARNTTITTGQANQNFYTYAFFDRCLAPCNNSPQFNDAPVSVICTNQPQFINMSAVDSTDKPADSISYNMDTAWQSATLMCTYASGYSPGTPLSSFTPVTVDPVTGNLSFISNMIQDAVVVVAVKEWRKIAGVYQLIGIIRRDIQLNIDICGSRYAPILPTQSMKTVCPGEQLCFSMTPVEQNSGDSVRLTWSNNIRGATFTTSYASGSKVQTGTFCWTPTNAQISSYPYYFAVLATDNSCDFTLYSTRSYTIRVKNQALSSVNPVGPLSLPTGDSILLSGPSGSGYTYQWLYNGSAISGATQSTRYAKLAGNYRLVINTTDNCPDTSNTVIVNSVSSINSFPYYESFESSNGGYTTAGSNISWEWGTPNKSTITKAANGSKCWATRLTAPYYNNESSQLISPIFNMSGLTANPVLAFNFSRALALNDVCWVEYKDGATWTKLGTFGSGTNWYNTPIAPYSWAGNRQNWHVASFVIPLSSITNKTTVQFRFVFQSNASVNDGGIGIDDITIHDNEPIWAAGTAVVPTGVRAMGSNSWLELKSGSNRVVAIKDNGFSLDSVTAFCYRNTSGTVRSINAGGLQFYLDRSWVVKTKFYPTIPISVRLYITEAEFAALDAVDPVINSLGQMGITKYTGSNEDNSLLNNTTTSGRLFIPPSSIRAVLPFSNGYMIEFDVNGFSEFWVNGGTPTQSVPLPVEFVSFRAEKVLQHTLLKWTTASEINNNHFDIERATELDADGRLIFKRIGVLEAKGSPQTINQYSFEDMTVKPEGKVYYRLKQVDNDGAYSYSEVRVVDFETRSTEELQQIKAIPNPFNNEFTLSLVSDAPRSLQLGLYDLKGNLLMEKRVQVQQGYYEDVLPGNLNLEKGFYILRIAGEKGVYHLKLLKQ